MSVQFRGSLSDSLQRTRNAKSVKQVDHDDQHRLPGDHDGVATGWGDVLYLQLFCGYWRVQYWGATARTWCLMGERLERLNLWCGWIFHFIDIDVMSPSLQVWLIFTFICGQGEHIITSMPSRCARVMYRRILQFLNFDQLNSCYRFKAAFHLHIKLAENRG